jgi:UDP-3-O-[3-hydroxymyristoyl] glucosamine N-acyltransferase
LTRIYSLAHLAQHLGAELVGDPDLVIEGIANLLTAGSRQISFLSNVTYQKYLAETRAGAVIIAPDLAESFAGNKLVIANPYLAYARLTQLFSRQCSLKGIHPSAVIGDQVELGEGVVVGPNAVIGDRCVVGEGTIVGPGTVIGDDCRVGKFTRFAANVTLYEDVIVGDECLIHSSAVIGADGFGFARNSDKSWVKIYQLGRVVIGNRVEIGATSTVDRGALDDTIIGDGVKIDNIVHTAHNVRMGKNVAIAAMSGISGSTEIGDNTTLSGGVGVVGHISIANDVHITGMSMVSATITEPGSYSSGTVLAPTREWRKNAVRFRQLDSLANRIRVLEKALQKHDLS